MRSFYAIAVALVLFAQASVAGEADRKFDICYRQDTGVVCDVRPKKYDWSPVETGQVQAPSGLWFAVFTLKIDTDAEVPQAPFYCGGPTDPTRGYWSVDSLSDPTTVVWYPPTE